MQLHHGHRILADAEPILQHRIYRRQCVSLRLIRLSDPPPPPPPSKILNNYKKTVALRAAVFANLLEHQFVHSVRM